RGIQAGVRALAWPRHVEAGAEAAPRAREDDRPHLGIGIGQVQRLVQLRLHGGVDRVEHLGAVQRDRDYWPGLVVQDRLVSHFDLHPSRGGRPLAAPLLIPGMAACTPSGPPAKQREYLTPGYRLPAESDASTAGHWRLDSRAVDRERAVRTRGGSRAAGSSRP